jgi:hypothetical protein
MRKAASASSNLNDGYRAIGEAVIVLTRSLKQFRLDRIEVWCGPQKLVCAMVLQGCRKADRAEVVERDHFAAPNYLKSHGERNLLSPFSNTCAITPKLCLPSGPIRPSKNYPALKSRTRGQTAPTAPPVPHFPRLRALALFGRRPPQRVVSLVMPASENLHTSRH